MSNIPRGPVPATLDFNQGDALKLLEADIEGMSSEDFRDSGPPFLAKLVVVCLIEPYGRIPSIFDHFFYLNNVKIRNHGFSSIPSDQPNVIGR